MPNYSGDGASKNKTKASELGFGAELEFTCCLLLPPPPPSPPIAK